MAMYWHKLDDTNRLSLAFDVYLAALNIADEQGAFIVCRDALERAGAEADEALRLAEQAHAIYLRLSDDIEAGKYGDDTQQSRRSAAPQTLHAEHALPARAHMRRKDIKALAWRLILKGIDKTLAEEFNARSALGPKADMLTDGDISAIMREARRIAERIRHSAGHYANPDLATDGES